MRILFTNVEKSEDILRKYSMTVKLSNEIGGYFGLDLETDKSENLSHYSIALNSGRNCLRYLIRELNIKKIRIPSYTCPDLIKSITEENCKIDFYHVNKNFLPEEEFISSDYILYTNYFGICSRNVKTLSRKYENLIVDNAQAYHMPMSGLASFNSARKFFGVPDGAFLHSRIRLKDDLQSDKTSINRFSHLLKRIDVDAQFGYEDYKKNDELLGREEIKLMSNITKALVCSHDVIYEKSRRLENFKYLHKHLKKLNELEISLDVDDIPMIYPFLVKDGKFIKNTLIENNIYVATYWNAENLNNVEQTFQDNLVPLPIDQRYGIDEMNKILMVLAAK